MTTKTDFKKKFENHVERAESRLAQWKSKFEKDPYHALVWSQEAFQEAAASRVFQYILAGIEKRIEKDGEFNEAHRLELIEYVEREVTRRASSPAFSTSVTSNLYETFETKAYAEALELLKRNW